MNGLSVVIITLNEEKNIGRCIDSVKDIADEIIVLDSYSTDATQQIAREKGAKVFERAFTDYVNQKNEANKYASNEWILSLDADEALSPELLQSIANIKCSPKYNAYKIARLTNYSGKWIKHCGWYPHKNIRLFNNTKGRWQGNKIHEKWKPDNKNEVAGEIKGDLLHYSYKNLGEIISQNNRFSSISAQAYFEKGKRSDWLKITLNPFWAFIHSFFIRLGFLDGCRGFAICVSVAHLTFMKYYKLYELQNGIPISSPCSKEK